MHTNETPQNRRIMRPSTRCDGCREHLVKHSYSPRSSLNLCSSMSIGGQSPSLAARKNQVSPLAWGICPAASQPHPPVQSAQQQRIPTSSPRTQPPQSGQSRNQGGCTKPPPSHGSHRQVAHARGGLIAALGRARVGWVIPAAWRGRVRCSMGTVQVEGRQCHPRMHSNHSAARRR